MRNTRAKDLRKKAVQNPSPYQGGYYGQTLVHGGWVRAYRDAKALWRRAKIEKETKS